MSRHPIPLSLEEYNATFREYLRALANGDFKAAYFIWLEHPQFLQAEILGQSNSYKFTFSNFKNFREEAAVGKISNNDFVFGQSNPDGFGDWYEQVRMNQFNFFGEKFDAKMRDMYRTVVVNDHQSAQHLLHFFPSLKYGRLPNNETFSHVVCGSQMADVQMAEIVSDPASTLYFDSRNNSPLHYLAGNFYRPELIKFFTDKGYSPYNHNLDGVTPIYLAHYYQNMPVYSEMIAINPPAPPIIMMTGTERETAVSTTITTEGVLPEEETHVEVDVMRPLPELSAGEQQEIVQQIQRANVIAHKVASKESREAAEYKKAEEANQLTREMERRREQSIRDKTRVREESKKAAEEAEQQRQEKAKKRREERRAEREYEREQRRLMQEKEMKKLSMLEKHDKETNEFLDAQIEKQKDIPPPPPKEKPVDMYDFYRVARGLGLTDIDFGMHENFTLNVLDKTKRLGLIHLVLQTEKSFEERAQDLAALFGYGLDVNFGDGGGNTALHYACKLNDKEMVGFLIEKGADCTIQNKHHQEAHRLSTNAECKKMVLKEIVKQKGPSNVISSSGIEQPQKISNVSNSPSF